MSVLSRIDTHDRHGRQRSVITIGCDGPSCPGSPCGEGSSVVITDDPSFGETWFTLLGDEDTGQAHFCSRICLRQWSHQSLVLPPTPKFATELERGWG